MIDDDLKRKKEKKQRTIIERFLSELLEKCVAAAIEVTMDELFEEVFGDGELGDGAFDDIEVEFETEDSDY